MDIRVTRTKVIIDNGYIVNEGEYKVNPCEFTFSEEYTSGLVKKAVFVAGNVEVERVILDDKCDIPYDVLNGEMFELHVYAYEVVEDELVLRYSPTYAKVFLREGSYRGVTGSGEVITPTQFEQYEQALNNGLDELEEGLQQVANVDIDANKVGGTATVTITNRLGVEKSVQIEDGTDYILTEQDKEDIADIAERDLTPLIPTKVSQLTNDSGYITKEVDDLTNYKKASETTTEINNVVNDEKILRENADTNLQNQIDAITSSTDVVDVVGTYTDLQNYDTSKLTDQDVIKVLQDSTHNNAISYYRWVVTSNVGAWNYVGSEGPFYTKGETDTLINAKQDTIDSSHKLSADLVDDTSTTNKFVTSGEKSTWNGKQDTLTFDDTPTANSNNPVKSGGIKTYVDTIVGDINSALDIINGEII